MQDHDRRDSILAGVEGEEEEEKILKNEFAITSRATQTKIFSLRVISYLSFWKYEKLPNIFNFI